MHIVREPDCPQDRGELVTAHLLLAVTIQFMMFEKGHTHRLYEGSGHSLQV